MENVVKIAVLILILIVVGLVFGFLGINLGSGSLTIITDKTEYSDDEALKVKIENNLKEKVCFSSCYPYYFEKKNTEWKSYSYSDCLKDNLNNKCVDPKKVKAFEIKLPSLEKGTHRLAIPVCAGCNNQDKFKEDKWFYSNEFTIK